MSALSDYPINSISTDKALDILQHYLRKVAKHQYVLEHNTNTILASLVSQLWDLHILIPNSASVSASISYLFSP